MSDWLSTLEQLEASATPAPWEYDGMHNEIQTPHGDTYWLIVSECRSAPDQELKDGLGHGEDANFALIAALRNEATRLLRIARAAKDFCDGYHRDDDPTYKRRLDTLRAALEPHR